MKRVALVLHFYQPPMQDLAVTKEVLNKAYLPVLRQILAHDQAKVTINISACLLQQLHKLQKWEFFDLVRETVKQGKVELLQSPAYHPVLPLVSAKTIERQFAEASRLYEQLIGIQPGRGIFVSELAIDERTAGLLTTYGDYIMIDGTAIDKKDVSVTTVNGIRAYVNNRLACDILRSYPSRLTGEMYSVWIKNTIPEDGQMVIVTDVEVFGHHYEERIETLGQVFDDKDLRFVTLAEMSDVVAVESKFVESSWQHVPQDKYQTGPFWLWNNPKNPLQVRYWELAAQVEQMYDEAYEKTDPLFRSIAAEHLDMGLSSCYSYWISNWPWWHPELVERGVQQLIKCARTVTISKEKKLAVEEVYHLFLADLWKMHWSGQVEDNYRQFELERVKLVAVLPTL